MPRGNSAYAGLFFFSITEIEWCGSWTPHPTLFPHWLINHRQPWSANCSASAFANRMGTILPLALPFGSVGLPGLVLSWLPLPISLLLYYNNMGLCQMLTPSIVRRL